MLTGDDELDFSLICLTLLQNDFDLNKTVKSLKGNKRRIVAALERLEANITALDAITNNPEARMKLRQLLAGIRKNRQARPERE